jgi:hypothetical protein
MHPSLSSAEHASRWDRRCSPVASFNHLRQLEAPLAPVFSPDPEINLNPHHFRVAEIKNFRVKPLLSYKTVSRVFPRPPLNEN